MAKLKVSALMDSLSKFPKDAEVTVITDDNDNLDEECLSLCVKSKKMKPTFVLIPYDDADDTFSGIVEVGFCDAPEFCNGDCMDDCGCDECCDFNSSSPDDDDVLLEDGIDCDIVDCGLSEGLIDLDHRLSIQESKIDLLNKRLEIIMKCLDDHLGASKNDCRQQSQTKKRHISVKHRAHERG